LFSERSGVVNIGLEGMMIIGTVTGSFGTYYFTTKVGGDGFGVPLGPICGLAFGMVCGALFASIHALATVTFRIDHIVSGVVINLVAVGLARFLSSVFFGVATQSDPGQPHLTLIDIPLLSKIPEFGRAFQDLSPFVLVGLLAVFPVTFVLYRLRWGLRLRSAGENPEATRSLGVRVAPLRWQAVLLSGALAGLAGAFLSIEATGHWREGQTQGLGFIALAALILSNWNPKRLMAAAFLFGFAQAIPLTLDNWPIIRDIPDQFVNMTPYVVTIVVLAGFVGKVRPPAAAGRAYEGGTT
jgi:simple sugar transport system permease protein